MEDHFIDRKSIHSQSQPLQVRRYDGKYAHCGCTQINLIDHLCKEPILQFKAQSSGHSHMINYICIRVSLQNFSI